MAYTNAADVLPPNLIEEIQTYVQGTQIYIPRAEDRRLGWGMKNGARKMLEQRNRAICKDKAAGMSVDDVADRYHLSPDTIRKILYSRPRRQASARNGPGH